MIVKKFLIAKGNPTALVYDYLLDEKDKIIKRLLKEVEQVGFVNKTKIPEMRMMGNELCINATLAFAYTLNKKGELYTSGLKNPIKYSNEKNKTTIKLPIRFVKDNNIILLDGIGFIFFEKKQKSAINKTELLSLCKKYNLPAFGAIIYYKNRITPYVYVSAVDSFVKETACGSGSVAFCIYKRVKNVIQPTDEIISVKNKSFIEVSAKVIEME